MYGAMSRPRGQIDLQGLSGGSGVRDAAAAPMMYRAIRAVPRGDADELRVWAYGWVARRARAVSAVGWSL